MKIIILSMRYYDVVNMTTTNIGKRTLRNRLTHMNAK